MVPPPSVQAMLLITVQRHDPTLASQSSCRTLPFVFVGINDQAGGIAIGKIEARPLLVEGKYFPIAPPVCFILYRYKSA